MFKMTLPCDQCKYQATNSRQLSRHKANTHVENPLRCILCPFVTAYQTNLLRHRREVHGIYGTKGNKSCKFCGFEADDNDTLIRHQQQAHQDILKSARERFAREKKAARGNFALNNSNSDHSMEEQADDVDVMNNNGNNLLNNNNLMVNNLNNPLINNSLLDKNLIMNSMMMNNMFNKSNLNSQNDLTNRLFNFSNLTNLSNLTATKVTNGCQIPIDLFNNSQLQLESTSNSNQSDEDDKDFWKEGFIDMPTNLVNFNCNNINSSNNNKNALTSHFLANFQKNFNNTFKFNQLGTTLNDLNGLVNFNDLNLLNCLNNFQNDQSAQQLSNLCSPESQTENDGSDNNYEDESCDQDSMNDESSITQDQDQLAPTKIRRQYNCNQGDCDFKTVNPREFLYHRRDVHDQKVKIVECPFCVYACQYLQKLQRHMLLVHKLETSITPPADLNNNNQSKQSSPQSLIQSSKRKRLNNNQALATATQSSSSNELDTNELPDDNNNSSGLDKNINKCPSCSYESKWYSELQKHMRVHTNEKPFNCNLCSFKTKWKGDLNRHIKKFHQLNPNDLQSSNDVNNNNEDAIQNSNEDSNKSDDLSSLDDEEENNAEQNSEDGEYLDKFRNDEEDNGSNKKVKSEMSLAALGPLQAIDVQKDYMNEEDDEESFDQRHNQVPPASCEPIKQKTISSTLTLRNLNDNLVKVYKCSYCDFICNTASRFHVHFVQHLNTKPFMCSVCEQRSNYAWDIAKHIKMRSQKSDDHANADAVLVHHSGKRDYRKYDKYLILINKKDIDGDSKQQTDTRGFIDPTSFANLTNNQSTKNNNSLSLINNNVISNNLLTNVNNLSHLNPSSLSNLNSLMGTTTTNTSECSPNELTSESKSLSEEEDNDDDDAEKANSNQGDIKEEEDDDFNTENIVITPDITIGNEPIDLSMSTNNQTSSTICNNLSLDTLSNQLANFNAAANSLALSPLINNLTQTTNTTTSSTPNTTTPNPKSSKLFYCAYCDYTHRDSKSLVSHLSIHAGKKPFKCRLCGFSSNWREVLNRHVASRHSGTSADIEQLFKYTVSKYICRIIDEKGQINPGPEITTQATIKQQLPVSSGNLSTAAAISPSYQSSTPQPPLSQQDSQPQSINYSINNGMNNNSSFIQPNMQVPDLLEFQNNLLMLNTLLAQQLNSYSSFNNNSNFSHLAAALTSNQLSNLQTSNLANFSNLPNLTSLTNLNNFNSLNSLNSLNSFNDLQSQQQLANATTKSKLTSTSTSTANSSINSSTTTVKPTKPIETPEVLAKHGIIGRVSGFKGEFKCDKCPFRAEKAFHMDFHSKRHVKAPGADFKCDYCDFWVNAKKSLVKHVYLHKYKD